MSEFDKQDERTEDLETAEIAEPIAAEATGEKAAERFEENSGHARDLDRQECIDFLNAHPGVDPAQIPKDVWADVAKGVPLTDAYNRFENKQLKQILSAMSRRLGIQNQNAANRAKSIGSMKNIVPRDTFEDRFMAAFDKA